MPRLVFDTWAAAYGTSYDVDDALAPPEVELDVEREGGAWVGIDPPSDAAAGEVLFVDGVQRIDGLVTVVEDDRSIPAVAGSFAAGAVRHRGVRATVEQVRVGRGLFTSAEVTALDCGRGVVYSPVPTPETEADAFRNEVNKQMRALEGIIAADASAELVVIDGRLSGRRQVAGAVGLIKTHRQQYLGEERHRRVVAGLADHQRSPVFLIKSSHPLYSWYLRLPGPRAHPWSGIVRCEASGALSPSEALRLAGVTAATIPRFASSPHRDPRAPQNLTCIGELERQLRHRLGDARLLERMLRRACAART